MALPEDVTTRRATLDDLEMLRGLWRECRQPDYELEKRFTEFQIAVDSHGWILGALGLRFEGIQGFLYGVALRRSDMEVELLTKLLERAFELARRHGAARLWTREVGGVWTKSGFAEVLDHERSELPRSFGPPADHWQTLKLRDEPLKLLAAAEQLEAYLELEKMKTESLLRRGRILKFIVTLIAAAFFGFTLILLFGILRRRRNRPRL